MPTRKSTVLIFKDKIIIRPERPIEAVCPKCKTSFGISEITMPNENQDFTKGVRARIQCECKNCKACLKMTLEISDPEIAQMSDSDTSN